MGTQTFTPITAQLSLSGLHSLTPKAASLENPEELTHGSPMARPHASPCPSPSLQLGST